MFRANEKRGGLTIWAAVLLGAGFAGLGARGQSAPDVHTLAQRVDRHYNQIHSLKADFTETYDGMGMHREESGTLLLLKPGRMRWDYRSPAGKVFLLDGRFAWFYTPGATQVQRIPARQLDDLRSPLRYLLGHTQLEKEMVHLSVAPAAHGEYTLAGQPKGQENRVARLALTVTAEGAITGIEIQEADGATTRFTFTQEETNPTLAAGIFRFTPPAGIAVVEALPPV